MSSLRIAIFPGSFDPIHNGHVDLVERAVPLFDEIVIAVLNNPNKQTVLSLQERLRLLEELFGHRDGEGPGASGANVRVASFDGLVAEFALAQNARFLLRGLRSGADFEYELPMTVMNRRLNAELETVFLPTRAEHADLSSSLIKEVLRFGGDPGAVLPPKVLAHLRHRLAAEEAQ